jgi:DNA-3-methyladenine glycosylase II
MGSGEIVSPQAIADHLAASDPYLALVVKHLGTQSLPKRPGGFRALARSIIYQQISGAAGAAIIRRIDAASGAHDLPDAEWFADTPAPALRKAGLSPQKIGYMKDLARRVASKELDFRALPGLADQEVIATLTEVHGVGRWTAEMYLLFILRRPDIWPIGDLGLRKAIQRRLGQRSLPSERTSERAGRPYSPYRSYATLYLWRSLEHPAETFAPPTSRRSSTAR